MSTPEKNNKERFSKLHTIYTDGKYGSYYIISGPCIHLINIINEKGIGIYAGLHQTVKKSVDATVSSLITLLINIKEEVTDQDEVRFIDNVIEEINSDISSCCPIEEIEPQNKKFAPGGLFRYTVFIHYIIKEYDETLLITYECNYIGEILKIVYNVPDWNIKEIIVKDNHQSSERTVHSIEEIFSALP